MELVQDVMSKDVQMVLPNTKLYLAAQKMRDHNIGFLVVADGNDVVGCVTDRDIVVNGVARRLDPGEKRIEDVMTRHIIACKPHQKVSEAIRLMRDQKVHRLIVLDADGNPVGVVSLRDLAYRTELSEDLSEALRELAQSA